MAPVAAAAVRTAEMSTCSSVAMLVRPTWIARHHSRWSLEQFDPGNRCHAPGVYHAMIAPSKVANLRQSMLLGGKGPRARLDCTWLAKDRGFPDPDATFFLRNNTGSAARSRATAPDDPEPRYLIAFPEPHRQHENARVLLRHTHYSTHVPICKGCDGREDGIQNSEMPPWRSTRQTGARF